LTFTEAPGVFFAAMNTRIEQRGGLAIVAFIKGLAWFLVNALQLAFTLAWSAFWITAALVVKFVTRGRHVSLRMASRIWAPGLLWGSGTRVRIEGREQVDFSRPHVLVANHQSIIDICVLFRAVPVPLRFLLKEELGRIPFLGWYTRAMGMYLIRRNSARQARQCLDAAVDNIAPGTSLCGFPEGTRSRAGQVGPFRAGIFRLAIKAGVPVIPVALTGTGRILPPGGFNVRPGRAGIRFGQPIPTTGLEPADWKQLARSCRDRIQSMVD